VNPRPKSVVQEICTLRSVGGGGGRLPPPTRWAFSNGRPYRERRNPRFVLCIGTAIGRRRDQLLAQNFLEEITDRKLGPGIRGVLQLGANHAKAISDTTEPTSRMILEKRGFKCVSIRTLSDFTPEGNNAPDDAVVSLDTPLDNITQGDLIRLTSLVDKTPVTIPTDKSLSGRPSPFRKVTFGLSTKSVAEQFEFTLLQRS
jgi:hypothetical protein